MKKKETTDDKIDNLAIMVARGFEDIHKKFEGVNNRFEDVYSKFEDIHKDIGELRKEINQGFENHIKAVRIDYDNLTSRVKVLEIAQK